MHVWKSYLPSSAGVISAIPPHRQHCTSSARQCATSLQRRWLPRSNPQAPLNDVHIRTRCRSSAGDAEQYVEPAAAESPLRHDANSATLLDDPWAWRRQQLGQILRFCGPALSIPLAEPLMSIVDNVCVGQFAGTLELASLAPTGLIFSLGYIFNALSIATLSTVASSIQDGDRKQATNLLSAAIFIAFFIGVAVLVSLQVYAEPLIRWTGCAAELVAPAVDYTRIRVLAYPAVLVTMCAQAGLLAQKDSITPLVVILVSASINVIGDILLIMKYGMGVKGAAWATAGSQILGMFALLFALGKVSKVKPRVQMPTGRDLRLLASSLGPLTLVYLCKNAVYIQLQLTAAVLQPVVLAAHQLLYSVWVLTSFLTVPLEQAALTFMPTARNALESAELAKIIVFLGTMMGVAGGLAAAGVPLFVPQVFTSDVALHAVMATVLPQVLLSMCLCGIDVSSNGLLLAQKDMRFVTRSMAITFVFCSAYFYVVRQRGLWGFHGVWWGLCLFFALRAFQSIPRLWNLLKPQASAEFA